MLRFLVVFVSAAAVLSIGVRVLVPAVVDGPAHSSTVLIGGAVWVAALGLATVDRLVTERRQKLRRR